MLDSLDTMVIMKLDHYVSEGLQWIKSNLRFDQDASISVFETTIRALGGLISAYDLTGEPVLLEKAKDLANRLLPAFNTPSGVPHTTVNFRTYVSST